MLNQPFTTALQTYKRFLFLGCGGGYDIFAAIPFVFALQKKQVYLASLSFCNLKRLTGAVQDKTYSNLYEIPSSCATEDAYCPEAWLARWLEEKKKTPTSIFGLKKTGILPLQRAYTYLVKQLQIDCIVLFDGGIDALLRGDESSIGTPAEDLASLGAVSQISGPQKFLFCLGFGAELRDGICHAQVFRRIAALTQRNAFLGTSALLPSTELGTLYQEAVQFVFSHQEKQRKSHVQRVVCDAMNGKYGVQGPDIYLNPLLHLYWFFSLPEVADSHLFLHHLLQTEDIGEMTLLIEGLRKNISISNRESIPL